MNQEEASLVAAGVWMFHVIRLFVCVFISEFHCCNIFGRHW